MPVLLRAGVVISSKKRQATALLIGLAAALIAAGPVAVVLGATSLSGALNGIDEVGRAAAATKSVIGQTRAARHRVEALRRSLAARSDEVARLERAAAEREAALLSARAEREGYLALLRSEQRLTAEQISALDARARAA